MPPSQVNRSSTRSRPRTPSHTARPSANWRRVSAARRLDRARPRRRHPAARQIRLAGAAGVLNLARHVEPADPPVVAEVLPEVGQLQRGAQRVRRSIERVVAVAGDAQHETADRIGRSTAVIQHVAPRGVAGRHGILTERAHEIVEQRDGQVERPDRVADRGQNRSSRSVVPGSPARRAESGATIRRDGAMQAGLPRAQLGLPLAGRRRAFVGDVVGDPREGIERPRHADASPPAAGATPRENSRSAIAPACRTPRTPRRAARPRKTPTHSNRPATGSYA